MSGFGEIVVGTKIRLFDTGDLVDFTKLLSLSSASQADDSLSTRQTVFGGRPTGAVQPNNVGRCKMNVHFLALANDGFLEDFGRFVFRCYCKGDIFNPHVITTATHILIIVSGRQSINVIIKLLDFVVIVP